MAIRIIKAPPPLPETPPDIYLMEADYEAEVQAYESLPPGLRPDFEAFVRGRKTGHGHANPPGPPTPPPGPPATPPGQGNGNGNGNAHGQGNGK